MSVLDRLLSEMEDELGLDKLSNDSNGAPETPNQSGGGQDITSMANALIQKIEQFKTQVGQQVSGQQQNPEDGQQQADPSTGMAPPEQGGITVQTPGGSVVKIASLIKIAALHGGPLFREVE